MIALIVVAVSSLSLTLFLFLKCMFAVELNHFLSIFQIGLSYLTAWAFLEITFSKYSFIKVYRLRRLLQKITVELSNMNKQVVDMPFHAVAFEFFIVNKITTIRCFTSGFISSENSIEKLPAVFQNFLIAESICENDKWKLLETAIFEGYIEMKFGDKARRIVYTEEDFQ